MPYIIFYSQHRRPARGDIADSLVTVHPEEFKSTRREIRITEQLWARRLANGRFEICCIPFFVHNLALGDVVTTVLEEKGTLTFQKGHHKVRKVIKRSGNRTYWLIFGDLPNSGTALNAVETVRRLGCLFEWGDEGLLAINLAPGTQIDLVKDALKTTIKEGHIKIISNIDRKRYV